MSFWTFMVIAVIIWGAVTVYTRRHDRELGVTRDEDGNPVFAPSRAGELETSKREIEDLRERIAVLERIATDANTSDARKTAQIASEIEALREADEAQPGDPGKAAAAKHSPLP